MLQNKICPYCLQPLTRINRSREHLIPKIAYTNSKGLESDFFACKDCNNRKKGYLDSLIGWYSKTLSNKKGLQKEAFEKALEANDHTRNRAIRTIQSGKRYGHNTIQLTYDITGDEIIRYGEMLAKGAFFLHHKSPLLTRKSIINIDFAAGETLEFFQKKYHNTNGTYPFEDLKKTLLLIIKRMMVLSCGLRTTRICLHFIIV